MEVYLDMIPNNEEAFPGSGTIPAEYAIVGMAPGLTRKGNEPLGGRSREVLEAVASERPGGYYTNLIKTPQDLRKKARVALVRSYVPTLYHELKLVLWNGNENFKDEKPKRVLILGSSVASEMCNGFRRMTDDHGTFFYNEHLNAFLVPTHPFYEAYQDPDKMKELARDLERFFDLPDPIPPEYEEITIDSYEVLADDYAGWKMMLDIESTGLSFWQDEITDIGFLFTNGQTSTPCYQIRNIHENPQEICSRFLDKLHKNRITVVGHNLGFDMGFLYQVSGEDYTALPLNMEDTMLIYHVRGDENKKLKHLTTMYTDRPGSRAYGGTESPLYLAEDVYSTRDIYNYAFNEGWATKFASELLNRVLPHFIFMRQWGVNIDQVLLAKIASDTLEQLKETEQKLNQMAREAFDGKGAVSINWNSPDQVVAFFQAIGVRLTEKTPSGKYSVKESVLELLAPLYPGVQTLLDFRSQSKYLQFIESYQEFLAVDGKLHPKANLGTTRTGRLSYSDPNLQQVPRVGPLKQVFTSRFQAGKIGLIDLSQAELRVAALLADDPKFAEALLSEDAHRLIASWAYNIPYDEVDSTRRKKSKGITFGLLYGGTPEGLAWKQNMEPSEIQSVMDRYFEKFPILMGYLDMLKQWGCEHQEMETLFGRRRDLSRLMFYEGPKSVARKAVNTPIQSLASDITLIILLTVAEGIVRKRLRSKIVFGVHDSVILDVHYGEVSQISDLVQEGFMRLGRTPLGRLPLWHTIPVVGEFIVADSWAKVESTNSSYDPEFIYPCSSHPLDERPNLVGRNKEDDSDPWGLEEDESW